MICFKIDKMTVEIHPDRLSMGRSAALDVVQKIHDILNKKDELNMVFAAAPSQNEFLEALISEPTIDWSRINAFHMDEYIGLSSDSSQSFGFFLKERIFGKVPFKNVYYIDGKAVDTDKECIRYSKLLSENQIDIVCLGIGENGHIAFNDPHVADFNDPKLIKVVDLDEECRLQQVHDECFVDINDVPNHAYTLTVPLLVSATDMFCIVPGKTKSGAVKNAIFSPVSERCPATILRDKEGARLYLDKDSASLLNLELLAKCDSLKN